MGATSVTGVGLGDAGENIIYTKTILVIQGEVDGLDTRVTTLETDTDIVNQTTVAAASGDLILIADASDSYNIKNATAQTIANLAAGGAATELPLFTTTAAAYTAGTNSEVVVLADATSNTITITLPVAASSTNRRFYVKKIDSTINTVTIEGNGAETIDGELNIETNVQWASFGMICDGSNWFII